MYNKDPSPVGKKLRQWDELLSAYSTCNNVSTSRRTEGKNGTVTETTTTTTTTAQRKSSSPVSCRGNETETLNRVSGHKRRSFRMSALSPVKNQKKLLSTLAQATAAAARSQCAVKLQAAARGWLSQRDSIIPLRSCSSTDEDRLTRRNGVDSDVTMSDLDNDLDSDEDSSVNSMEILDWDEGILTSSYRCRITPVVDKLHASLSTPRTCEMSTGTSNRFGSSISSHQTVAREEPYHRGCYDSPLLRPSRKKSTLSSSFKASSCPVWVGEASTTPVTCQHQQSRPPMSPSCTSYLPATPRRSANSYLIRSSSPGAPLPPRNPPTSNTPLVRSAMLDLSSRSSGSIDEPVRCPKRQISPIPGSKRCPIASGNHHNCTNYHS